VTTDFDARAETWDDDQEHRDRAATAAALVRETVPIGRSTRLLEYGAGTGLLAAALAADVGSVIVADPSAGMRAVLARKLAAGVFGAGQVLDLDLARDPAPDLEVDLVLALLSLHHVPELAPVPAGFVQLLAEGGAVGIIDLEEEDGSFHGEGFDGHHGFARERLTAELEAAGFTGVAFRAGPVIEKEGRRYPLFLCTAARGPR
jgi:SAM-dependent methyltransferase